MLTTRTQGKGKPKEGRLLMTVVELLNRENGQHERREER